ncbi:hypothetical protein AZ66_07525 [Paenibacillus sp. E194]|uniref:hypothetical protein n=1 Tax=Paenibacillus sp. E194 TaxID=1458845 RepID=UPI0005CA42F5|nr:hypothetical protein [Paenibacillus sp. E194]KJB88406.1 hypothetical protein AZ66_07525 [Paenibacillus sp. E194]
MFPDQDKKRYLRSERYKRLQPLTYWKPVRIYDTFKSILASKFGTTGYTHVSKDRVRRIMSPRDRIMSEMREDGTDSNPTTQGG